MIGKTYFSLDRFEAAQLPVYESALSELKAGHKQGHWMWFIFPQLRGLGRSSMADLFALSTIEEAQQYLAHPVLGLRLRECTQAVLDAASPSLQAIFGSPDDLKFCSSMTLFHRAACEEDRLFAQALDRWCDGRPDPKTLEILDGHTVVLSRREFDG